MSRESVALISLFPLGSLGGGEFLTLNALKAVAVTGARCRLYAAQNAAPPSQPLRTRLETPFLRVFDSESRDRPAPLRFQDLLGECAEFDTVWVHQYLSNDLIFDLIANTAGDQRLLLTNHGHEPLRDLFSRLYQPSPNHWCVEVSRFSSERAAQYTRQRSGVSAAAWRRECLAPEPPPPFRRRACCVGRVLPHKGVEITIQGLPAGYQLDVLGGLDLDPAYTSHLRQAARGRDVRFLGAQDEAAKQRLLAGSDLLIASSCLELYNGGRVEQAELLGLVILEAAASGVQPVTSDLPPFREVMETLGLEEFVYPQRDSAALGEVLRRYEALGDEARAELRSRMQARLHEHFLFDDYWSRIRKAAGMEQQTAETPDARPPRRETSRPVPGQGETAPVQLVPA